MPAKSFPLRCGRYKPQSPKRQPMLRFHALAGENTTQRLELVRSCAKSDVGAAQSKSFEER